MRPTEWPNIPAATMPISDLGLKPRTLRLLKADGVSTVGDIATWSDGEFLRHVGFGRTSLVDVRSKLGWPADQMPADPEKWLASGLTDLQALWGSEES